MQRHGRSWGWGYTRTSLPNLNMLEKTQSSANQHFRDGFLNLFLFFFFTPKHWELVQFVSKCTYFLKIGQGLSTIPAFPLFCLVAFPVFDDLGAFLCFANRAQTERNPRSRCTTCWATTTKVWIFKVQRITSPRLEICDSLPSKLPIFRGERCEFQGG